jgi:hypothetical protein
MTKGEILAKYKHLSPDEQRTFARWLQANAVIGLIFVIALVAIALNGSQSSEPATQTSSFFEQHGLAHLNNLPVQLIEDQTLVFTVTEPGPHSRTVSSKDSAALR